MGCGGKKKEKNHRWAATLGVLLLEREKQKKIILRKKKSPKSVEIWQLCVSPQIFFFRRTGDPLLTAQPILPHQVFISDGVGKGGVEIWVVLGCSKGSFLHFHCFNTCSGQSVTKCTLAILVGLSERRRGRREREGGLPLQSTTRKRSRK